jgi:hypothetical protein
MENTLPVVREVSKYVQSGDIEAAEYALVAIADSDGDQALVAVIDAMPEADLIAILREYDSSRETAVASLLTPEKFASVIGLESRYIDPHHERLRGMIHAVVLADEDRTGEYLDALGNCDGGLTALRDYFFDRHAELEYLANHDRIDQSQVVSDELSTEDFADLEALLRDHEDIPPSRLDEHSDGGWMQLAWLLRFQHPEIFVDVLRLLRRSLHLEESARATPLMPEAMLPAKRMKDADEVTDDDQGDDEEESAL